MKITYFLLIALLFVSCNTNKNTDQLSARQIFDKLIEAAGGQSLYSSTITFNMAELNYVFYRQKNISNFEVTRQTDSIFYKATYNNGSTAYYENEVLQEESSALRKFIEAKFEAVAHLMAIPQAFDQNATIINRIEFLPI